MKGQPRYKHAETFPTTCSLNVFTSDMKSKTEKCVWRKIIYSNSKDLAVRLQNECKKQGDKMNCGSKQSYFFFYAEWQALKELLPCKKETLALQYKTTGWTPGNS